MRLLRYLRPTPSKKPPSALDSSPNREPWPSLPAHSAYPPSRTHPTALSFLGFNLSLRALEISLAYAVWSASVIAILSLVGMTLLHESVSFYKIAGISLITLGTLILQLIPP